jgi:superfamily II DNA/RNA helicase
VKKLRRVGISALELHGKLDQESRTTRLRKFKSGKTRVLIATDLVSRGLDIKGLPVVVNYDLPRSPAGFTHRIGRTGRAGMNGIAVSFVTPSNESHFNLIERKVLKAKLFRETLPGHEPDEGKWDRKKATSEQSLPGVQHSNEGLAHDKMYGGIKGARKSKKDKLREAVTRAAQTAPSTSSEESLYQ